VTGRLSEIPPDHAKLLLSWQPESSNCPELTETLKQLIQSVPGEWRALIRNLFVGRVIDGEVNAAAWTKMKAGIVEINIQYTLILGAYVATFDDYVHSIKSLFQGIITEDKEEIVRKLNKRILTPWEQLDKSRLDWANPMLIRAEDPALLGLGTYSTRKDLQAELETACEAFIIAHELAHHLLGHTISRSNKTTKATIVVDEALQESRALARITVPNNSQRDEIQADTLAFLIIAKSIDRTAAFNDLYRATMGSIISLMALAHVNDAWIEPDATASQPDLITRYEVIFRLAAWPSEGRPRGEIGDHPLGLLAQLSGFCSIAVRGWLTRNFPNDHQPINILQVGNHFLEYACWLDEEINNPAVDTRPQAL
jgi:hypothetical protein